MQRFVQTLRLVDNPEAIAEYRRIHDNIWPEIVKGIRSIGILDMEIYLTGNLAVMVMEMPDGIDADAALARLATLPRQEEWEEYVGMFQQCLPGDTSADKWKRMTKIFSLPE